MADNKDIMEFIETPMFTKLIIELLPDDRYRLLQDDIAKNPQAGDLIPGGGGIRKLRFALPGKGKRGGARLIYYWQTSKHKTYMLLAYAKAKKETLEPEQMAILKALVKELERHG
jgi:mRNA-degrading endonuclease RelE of RelBE toxin-antitoxin system